ncbi:EAL domain-containing protein [Caminibacter sp.]
MVIDFLMKAGEKTINFIENVFEKAGSVDGLSEKNLRAFLQDRGVSDLLMYRYYEEQDDIGIYTMADGRKGFVLRYFAPVFVTEETEIKLMTLIESLNINKTQLQFVTFSSQNLTKHIEAFINSHPCEVNVTNREILKEVIEKRAKYLQKWAKEPMFKGYKFRLRDFVNLIAITYPPNTDIETIKMEYESVKGIMRDYNAVNFSADELVTLLREFFHFDKDSEFWNSKYDSIKALNHQVVSGGVKVELSKEKFKKGFVINDSNYVTTLVTKEFPLQISAEEFVDFFYNKYDSNDVNVPIDGPFIASLNILIEDVDRIKEQTLSKLSHDLGEIRKFDLRTIERYPEMKERLNEVKGQIKAIKVDNEYPLKSMWSLTLFNTDRKNLLNATASIKEKFRRKGWYLTEETFPHIGLFTTLFSLPLQYSDTVANFLKRFDLLFKSNNTAIVPIIGDFRGFGFGHIPFFGRSGQIIWWDPYAEGTENYNVVATGRSGSGKSFTFNDVITMSLAKNAKVRVIDSLPSYQRLTELIGGQYVNFDEKSNICLNFFTNILTKRNEETGEEILVKGEDGKEYPVIMEEDMATIVPLMAMMARVDRVVVSTSSEISSVNDSVDASFLASVFEEAVTVAFRSKGRNAGMYDVRKYLLEKRDYYKQSGYQHYAELLHGVCEGLRPFSEPDGMYYKYFNGVANLDLEKDLVVVELSALEQKGVIYPVVLMALANMIVNEFFGDDVRQKILIMDEFWKFKDNLIVSTFTEELARKVRKMRGSLMTITQGQKDYKANVRMEALFANSSWKFQIGRETDATTGLGAFADKLLRTVAPHFPLFGENTIFTSTSMSINRLRVDPLCKWLYETSDRGKATINAICNKFNLSQVDAVRFLAVKEENPAFSDEEVLKEIGILDERELSEKQRREKERRKKIEELIKQALEFNELNLSLIPIVDEKKNIHAYETTAAIKNGDETINYGEFYNILKEMDKIVEFDRIVAFKAIQYAAYNQVKMSINLNLETFKNKKILKDLISLIEELKANDYVIFELPLRNTNKEDFEIIVNHINELKKINVEIANDNITLDSSFLEIINYPIDYLKIDKEVVQAIEKDRHTKMFLEFALQLSDRLGIEVVFIHIDRESLFEECVTIGGKYFEGFLFGRPVIV